MNPDQINGYHAHLYYDQQGLSEAKKLAALAKEKFGVAVGRFHEKPVGPHPVGSCQLTVNADQFSKLIPWLMLNRGSIDIFVHALSGDDYTDHSDYVMWIGKSYELNLDMFKAKD